MRLEVCSCRPALAQQRARWCELTMPEFDQLAEAPVNAPVSARQSAHVKPWFLAAPPQWSKTLERYGCVCSVCCVLCAVCGVYEMCVVCVVCGVYGVCGVCVVCVWCFPRDVE